MKRAITLVLLLLQITTCSPLAAYAKEASEDKDAGAVSIVRELPGAPVLDTAAEIHEIKTSGGKTADEIVAVIPSGELKIYTYETMDQMDGEDREQFQKQVEEVKALDEDLVRYLFWIDLPDKYEGLVGPQKDGSVNELQLFFTSPEDDGEACVATVNGEETELDRDEDGNYVLHLKKLGGVIIMPGKDESSAARDTKKKEEYLSPTKKEAEREKSSAAPVFDDDYYDIKIVLASEKPDGLFEEDELVVEIPRKDLFITPIDEADTLKEEDRKRFNEEFEKVKNIDGYIVQYFFYVDLAEQYRNLIGEQEDGSIQYLLLSFVAKKDRDYRVTANGSEMEVQSSKEEEGKYYVKLSELGSVAIMYPET